MHGVVQYGDVAWPVAAASTVQSKSWTVATQVPLAVLMTEHEATMVAAKHLNMFVRVVVVLCVVVRCCVMLRVLSAVSGRGRGRDTLPAVGDTPFKLAAARSRHAAGLCSDPLLHRIPITSKYVLYRYS